jgi:hypothetical protein
MSERSTHRNRQASIGLLSALVITVVVYWTGLHGPFLLDDGSNLSVIGQWLAGQAPLHDVIFATTAAQFGRPISMASFALSAQLGGYTPFAFKLGNLLVHLACGLLLFALIRRVAGRDARLQPHADMVALLVSALWLLHPLNASTVLYAVQRMAQLSTLVMLAGMYMYMVMRERLAQTSGRRYLAGIVIGIPLLTVLGCLAKENAVLLPALCLVLELGCFRSPRPRPITLFFAGVVVMPLLAGLAVLAVKPAWLLGGYVSRDFDWQQRLLTQGRVLIDYLSKILLPNPLRMGVYTDDFVVSTGLVSPPATLIAILALLAVSIAAWRLRTRVPALFVGWGIFVVGHAIESSIVPLEMYFEHRNYLPMIGVLYAAVGLVMAAGAALKESSGMQTRRIGTLLAVAILALLAFGTHGRARVWGDEALLVESAVAAHPNSMRAQLAVVDAAIRLQNLPRASVALDAMTHSDNGKARAQGHLNRINLACALLHVADPQDLQLAMRDAPARISKDESETFSLLLTNTSKPCKGISNSALADAAATFADRASSQPDWFGPKAELRHTAARLYARDGNWAKAGPVAQLAWQPGMPAAASVVLIQSQLAGGDLKAAERTYVQAITRVDPSNPQDAAGMRWLRGQIDAARAQAGPDAGTAP